MPDNNESSKAASSSSSTVIRTVAGIALGAAVAFGAYFLGRTEGHDEAKQSYQQRVNYAQNMTPKVDRAKDDDDEKISRDCVICARSFKSIIDKGEEIHSTPCGHILCKSCIDSTQELWAKCPICNEELLPNQSHRIFL